MQTKPKQYIERHLNVLEKLGGNEGLPLLRWALSYFSFMSIKKIDHGSYFTHNIENNDYFF